MKVKNKMHNGQLRWIVDGKINGKRNRLQFDNEKQANSWLKAYERNGDPKLVAWWLDLTNGQRADIMNSFEKSSAHWLRIGLALVCGASVGVGVAGYGIALIL